MTKKDYIRAADLIAEMYPLVQTPQAARTYYPTHDRYAIKDFCERLFYPEPSFDPDKFTKYLWDKLIP